jgi:hypothetical protein
MSGKVPSMAEIAAFDAGRMSPEEEAAFTARVQDAGNLFIPKRFARARSLTTKGQQDQAVAQAQQRSTEEPLLANFPADMVAKMSPAQRARFARGQQLADEARQGENEADIAVQRDSMTAVDKAGAFALGAADTMSMGFADEARGALALADPRLHLGNIVRSIKGQEAINPLDYARDARDEQAEVSRIAREDVAPMEYGIGSLVGIVPGALGGAGSTVARAGIAAKVAQGAKAGAAQAGAQGFGEGRGLEDSAKRAALNSVIGAVMGGGLTGAGALATKAGRAEIAAGANAAGNAGKAAVSKVMPTVRAFADKTDNIDPIVLVGLTQLPGVGKPLAASIAAARWLRKMAPEIADATPLIIEESTPDAAAGVTRAMADDIGAVVPQASGLGLARPPRPPVDAPPPAADDLGNMSTQEIDAMARSFEGGTGPQTSASPAATGGDVDVARARAAFQAVRAGQPIPEGGIQAGTRTMRAVTPTPPPPARLSRMTPDEQTALVRSKAIEMGTRDVAALSSATGLSSSATADAVRRLVKTFSFRDAVEKAKMAKGGAPSPPAASAPPLPPPELVEHFLKQGATREQALAQAYAVMAKRFASKGPELARGRQRSAVKFDDASPGPAPIATPKGRNRSSAPFQKKNKDRR